MNGKNMKRYVNGQISIPHAEMVKLKNSGKLNLGMFDDIAVKIADNPDLAPKSKSTGLAMHLWSLVAVGQFLFAIYYSFTNLWWVFIPSFFLMVGIHRANKKGQAKIYYLKLKETKSFMKKLESLMAGTMK